MWSKYFGKAIRNDCQYSIKKGPAIRQGPWFLQSGYTGDFSSARTNIDCLRAFLALGNLVLYRLVII